MESTTSLQPPQLSWMRLCWKIAETGAIFRGFLFTPVNLSAWCLLSEHFCPTTAPDGKHSVYSNMLFRCCAAASEVREQRVWSSSLCSRGRRQGRIILLISGVQKSLPPPGPLAEDRPAELQQAGWRSTLRALRAKSSCVALQFAPRPLQTLQSYSLCPCFGRLSTS